MTYKNNAGHTSFIDSEERYYENWDNQLRVIYDLSYIFIVIILLSEILSGIIIDTFTMLR